MSTEELNALSNNIKIPIWENPHQLPDVESVHSEQDLEFEKEYFFTFIQEPDVQEYLVFICPKTKLSALFQSIALIFESYRIFLCPSKLVSERLYALQNKSDLNANNEAGHLLNELMEEAISKRSSDIHIQSDADKIYKVRFRVDGILQPYRPRIPVKENLINKVKILSGMDISQRRVPQDGSFQFFSKRDVPYDIRSATIPGFFGEKLVLRILPAEKQDLSLMKLGLRNDVVARIKKLILERKGLILVTGATGSGKSTTLFSIINELPLEELNVVSVEDPVEYKFDEVTQVQINEKAGVTFESTLRAFLRQDPDVIFIGEIRDSETAKMAARAAQTGHLVLSTLHCNNSLEAISRLKNLGVPGEEIVSSLKLIMNQELVLKQEKLKIGSKSSDFCESNSTRIPVIEFLEVDEEVSNKIADDSPIDQLKIALNGENFISKKNYLHSMKNER